MELGGNNGGFHGYRRLTTTNSADMSNQHGGEESECIVREQDRFMPIANVIRIMRKILPPHAKISDDAKETIQECVSEYISFITSEANDRCQREQRKTITAEDVLWAMSKLGFDDYIEPLTVYLHRYREFDGGSLRGEPLVKRMVDHASMGFHGFPPPAFHHHGFFGAAPMNFFKDSPNAGPSQQAAVACIEPFPQHKDQL
ncbi:nuclear transcription factor Y subunit B-1 isoform X2 [Salvia miltiorrhiza]|uniref:nuclear transcription factor Y subunit B-1 isoform X2 n=1 Tax=Salvia miltiorrhiza TaxID=226208 RepID=UPI0025AB86A3|nr:nuclear transcription factor Y subunit B-1 isoform X2 [Salvia miltiorrhiza]